MTLALLFVGAACVVTVIAFIGRTTTVADTPAAVTKSMPGETPANANDGAQVERIARAVQDLELTVADLTRRIERLENQSRESVTGDSASDVASGPPGASELDPHVYLERYVASFASDGEGDEFYRLAVQAHAAELLDAIAAIVSDPRHLERLRTRLAEMLGNPRFRGRKRAIDALFAALMESGVPSLSQAALAALANVGDLAVADRLAAVVWTLGEIEMRKLVLPLIVNLYGAESNRAVARLFASAPTDADQRILLSLLTGADLDTALAVIRRASTLSSRDVRITAAVKIGTFHAPQSIALIDEWLGYERDEGVRRVLGEARGKASEVPNWDAMRATGPPDADPESHDDENAWACARADMGLQWLELTYQPALRANRVRVVELNVGGAVAQVIAIDDGGGEHTLYPGGQGTQLKGVFEVAFAATAYRVARLRVVLDTSRPGWNEIDAVELVGPDGRAWAVRAVASSNYGQ